MATIEFERDYGIQEGSPFWLVWGEAGRAPTFKHYSKESAEDEAARLARQNPGQPFHVLAVMATVSTGLNVIGTRFDPRRPTPQPEQPDPAPEPEPVFIGPETGFDPVRVTAPDHVPAGGWPADHIDGPGCTCGECIPF